MKTLEEKKLKQKQYYENNKEKKKEYQKIYLYGTEKAKEIETSVRPCLKCKTDFTSELDTKGIPYNRLCDTCRKQNETMSFGKEYRIMRSIS